jgi:hypothetical protein
LRRSRTLAAPASAAASYGTRSTEGEPSTIVAGPWAWAKPVLASTTAAERAMVLTVILLASGKQRIGRDDLKDLGGTPNSPETT